MIALFRKADHGRVASLAALRGQHLIARARPTPSDCPVRVVDFSRRSFGTELSCSAGTFAKKISQRNMIQSLFIIPCRGLASAANAEGSSAIKQVAQQRFAALGNIGYFGLATAFVMTDILALRTILVGGYLCVTSFHAVQEKPLMIPLSWSALFTAINAVMAYSIFKDRMGDFSEEEEQLYKDHFELTMARAEFRKLLQHGSICTATEKTQVIFPGKVANIVLILEGVAEVRMASGLEFTTERPGLFGNSSFLASRPASKQLFVTPGCRYVMWDAEELKVHLKKDTALRAAIELTLGNMLGRKLQESTSSLYGLLEHTSHLEYEGIAMRLAMNLMLTDGKSGSSDNFFRKLEVQRKAHAIPLEFHRCVMSTLGIDESSMVEKGAVLGDVYHALARPADSSHDRVKAGCCAGLAGLPGLALRDASKDLRLQ